MRRVLSIATLYRNAHTPRFTMVCPNLLADPPPREAFAACATRFSWEANAAALAAYYEGLLA